MPTKIVMTESVAMLVEETITDIVPLEDFRRAISMNAISTPVLPFGCVHYLEKKTKQIFTVVRRAEIREVNQANAIFKVAMPHRVYRLEFRAGNLTSVHQNLVLNMPSTLDEPVFEAPLPNRVKGGDICRTGVMIAGNDELPAFRVDLVINQVERTRHNTDHVSFAKECMPRQFRADSEGMYTKMLQRWAAWTEEHKDDWEAHIRDIQWVPNGTLGHLAGGGMDD